MLEKLYAHRKILLIIEAVVLIVLIGVMGYRMKHDEIIEVDLDTMMTDYDDAMSYDGSQWNFDKDFEKIYWGYDYLLYGPEIPLDRGTYTIVIDYLATETQKVVLESQDVEIQASEILLSKNKTTVRYDFKLANGVEDFKMRIIDFYGGEFSLKGVTIIRNTHDIRVLTFLWIVLAACLDLLIYNKKLRSHGGIIAVLFGIAILASLPLFAKGIMSGHDIRFHFARIEAIADGLKNGYFPVKMDSIYNDGYGYPVGIYYGDMLLYIPAVLRIIGFTITQSYKIYIFVVNLLTATTSYICGKKIFKKNNTAILFSLVFTASTYRLLCIYTRAAVGEFSANCFYPIVMLAIWNIYTQEITEKRYQKNAILLAVGMSGMIYNHVLSTEMIVLVLVVLALVLFKLTFRKQTLLVIIKAIALSALISLAFIVPFLEYYTQVDTMLDDSAFASSYIQKYGVYLSDYFAFFKSITGYANVDVASRMQITPGLVLMAGLIGACYLILTKKADSRIKVLTGGTLVCLFVASNLCPWNQIYEIPGVGPFLVSVQFPYRYVGMAVCFMTILLGLVVEKLIETGVFDRKLYSYTVVVSLLMTFVFVSAFEDDSELLFPYDTADLYTYTHHNAFGLGAAEYLLDDTDMSTDVLDYGVYGDNITAVIQSESGLHMEIWVDAGDDATLEVPRFAYPHFVATDDDGKTLTVVQGHNNKVTVEIPTAYQGTIFIDYVEPWYWRVAEVVSVLTIIGLLVWWMRSRSDKVRTDMAK